MREIGERERGRMKNGPVIRTKYLSYLFRVDQLNFKAEAECCAQFRNQVICPLSMRTKIQGGIQFDQTVSIER